MTPVVGSNRENRADDARKNYRLKKSLPERVARRGPRRAVPGPEAVGGRRLGPPPEEAEEEAVAGAQQPKPGEEEQQPRRPHFVSLPGHARLLRLILMESATPSFCPAASPLFPFPFLFSLFLHTVTTPLRAHCLTAIALRKKNGRKKAGDKEAAGDGAARALQDFCPGGPLTSSSPSSVCVFSGTYEIRNGHSQTSHFGQ